MLGPTGVGKTNLSLRLARELGSPIISCDSRQLYQGISIGTAAPTKEELELVKHYFVGTLKLEDYYNASQFEEEVISLLSELHKEQAQVIMTGGSMMYIDAVCQGIDDLPTIDPQLRIELLELYQEEGLEPIRNQLKILDPIFYKKVDLSNYKRVIHGLEVCLMTGKPYSSFLKKTKKQRPFKIIKIGLTRDREELYQRINLRVDSMMENGLLEEAQHVYPFRNLNSLNTVGYKELFKYLDGEYTLEFALEKIRQNTRIYSRKQMSWFNKDPEIQWFHPNQEDEIRHFIGLLKGKNN